MKKYFKKLVKLTKGNQKDRRSSIGEKIINFWIRKCYKLDGFILQHIHSQSLRLQSIKKHVEENRKRAKDREREESEEAEKGYRNYRECYDVHLQRIPIKLTQETLRHLSQQMQCVCVVFIFFFLNIPRGSWRHGNFFRILHITHSL